MEKEHNAKVKQLLGYNPTSKDLIKLRELTCATELDLSGTKISNAGLVHLQSLSNLTILHLNKTKISESVAWNIQ